MHDLLVRVERAAAHERGVGLVQLADLVVVVLAHQPRELLVEHAHL